MNGGDIKQLKEIIDNQYEYITVTHLFYLSYLFVYLRQQYQRAGLHTPLCF